MTNLGAAYLESVARLAALAAPPWCRDDVEGDVALALVEQDPRTTSDALRIARLAAGASRKREARRGLRGAALDGVSVGATDADLTLDVAASRILLDAALSAARAGFDFSSSRMRGGVLADHGFGVPST